MGTLLLIVPVYLILYSAFSLYTPKRVQGRRLELANIVKANTIGLFILIVVLYVTKENDFSRTVLFIFFLHQYRGGGAGQDHHPACAARYT